MSYDNNAVSEEPLRLFVAVALPAKIRAELHSIGRKVKQTLRFQKWTHADDIHITLKFLGDTSVSRIDGVSAALEAVAAGSNVAPFELSAAGLGVFGPRVRPTILWAGVRSGVQQLAELHRQVETAMTALGYEPESRAYRPHLTLARRYSGPGPFNRRELEPAESLLAAAELRWQASSFTLYRSHPGRAPMYEALGEFSLPDDTTTPTR